MIVESGEITTGHLSRLAMVYIRQSSARQVKENLESTELQYSLANRARAYGWPKEQVVVIDDDLGISGQSLEGREGFRRLLAEISLGHVGIVLEIEMSRLARNCRDRHQLLELCAVFGSLLGDADGVYNPRDHNDRLLLGLKGSVSEAELHVLRSRLEADAELARRRYEKVDPSDRLVAAELERSWESLFQAQRRAEEVLNRFRRETPVTLTPEQRESIMQLANDFAAWWNSNSTTNIDRQTIVRTLIDDIVVEVADNTESLSVTVHIGPTPKKSSDSKSSRGAQPEAQCRLL